MGWMISTSEWTVLATYLSEEFDDTTRGYMMLDGNDIGFVMEK